MAPVSIYRSASHGVTSASTRVPLSQASNEKSVPAPAYLENGPRRTKSSIPARIIRRFTLSSTVDSFDPNTVPVLTKRAQRKAEKRERCRLDELQEHQRKQFHDQISRQLEVNQSEREGQYPPRRRTVKEKVKDTLRRTTRSSRRCEPQPRSLVEPHSASLIAPQHPPHVDEFQNKNDLQQWFHSPSDVEAPLPHVTPAPYEYPAELPAIDIASPYHILSNNLAKKKSGGSFDFESLPPPIRSPSPCLSSLPQRGMTISEIPLPLASKQMQCDSCHDAIKMTGFHYACGTCNDADCLYCAKCVNGGRTCRHELIERTRNIKRHPSNPQSTVDRRLLALDRESVISSEAHIELSALHPHSILPPLNTKLPTTVCHGQSSPLNAEATAMNTATTPSDLIKDFEVKCREQEITFREKEVTLREREAMLREREAWTASRERDAALVQQLHAAAMLSERKEVGAQFSPCSPISRQSSYYDGTSRRVSRRSQSDFPRSVGSPSSVHRQSSRDTNFVGITIRASDKGKKPNVELASSVAAIEASIAGIEITDDRTRSRGNSTKRKSSSVEGKPQSSRTSSNKSQSSASRGSSKRSNDYYDEPDEDEDDDESGSPKRQKQDNAADEPQKLFACPYYKHDPIRYAEGNIDELSYRGCASGLFRDISRVKQHLKRTHHRSTFYCRRCFAVFANNDKLQRHSSSREACSAIECPYPEKLDETQQSRIHIKRPGKDPKDLWFEIFAIIFPNTPAPESPYIEQIQPISARPELLAQFVESFNRKLDLSHSNHPWLTSPVVRDFLNTQMLQTMQEVIQNTVTGGRSTSVPLGSPAGHAQSRQSSNSSRTSSTKPSNQLQYHHGSNSGRNQASMLSPASAVGGLRPALKVTTHDMQSGSEIASGSQSNSARSQRNPSFPNLANHVMDDTGYDNGESWASGDDMHVMGKTFTTREPASATSTRSTKSVSFAESPRQHLIDPWINNNTSTMKSWMSLEQNNGAPNLFDFAASDWSSYNFAVTNSTTHGQQQPMQPKPTQRADSAYGTLSSAQASRSSLFQPAPQPRPYVHIPDEDLTCVDPSKLYVGSSADVSMSLNSGLSADVQAYFNRNMNGYFDGV